MRRRQNAKFYERDDCNVLNMELRDSGRDLVQIKDDGTHAILPVTSRADVQPDHARVPVMLLRRSDGKTRRDGSRAATWQPDYPVDERGRLHGAPGLAVVEEPRILARIRGPCRKRERNGEWVRERRLVDRLRRQDKSRKVRAVGCGWVERRIPAITHTLCSVRRDLRFLAKCYCRSAFDTR
jgi:hypothetical protein